MAELDKLKEFNDDLQALSPSDRRKTLDKAWLFLGGSDDPEKRQPIKPRKLRQFSGAKDPRSGEVDFATWRLYAKPIVDDPFLRESEKKRVMLDSLINPALEIACTITGLQTSVDMFELLEKHFGDVADGFELYSQFRSAVQGMSETASEFLQRLHSLALRAVKKKGLDSSAVPKEVLRQFESACADDDLLHRLSLPSLFDSPPDVGDLLHSVRSEEARRREKKLKLKARSARANVVSACESSMASGMEEMQKKIEALTMQVQGFRDSQAAPQYGSAAAGPPRGESQYNRPQHRPQYNKPPHGKPPAAWKERPRTSRFGFCFQCGLDDHYQNNCTNPANPVLVQQRLLAGSRPAANNGQSGN